MAGVMGNDPQTSPNNSLAQTVDAHETVVEQRRLLDLICTKTVIEGDEKYGAIRQVAKKVEEGPKKRRFEAVAGDSSA